MLKNSDIETVLKKFKSNALKYDKLARYYKGDHDLAFATPKFKNAFGELFREFSLNLCPAVVDAVKDKLKVKEFRVESGSKAMADYAWELWQNNRMGLRSSGVHKEAAKMGDAYMIVWVDSNKKLTFYPQKAKTCTVVYDEEIPGRILFASKYWQTTDKKIRLNMYYADRIEKYITREKSESGMLPEDSTKFDDYFGEGDSLVINPYDTVPVFHFANNADIGELGISELESGINVQDALNKSVLDMLVAMEFASYRQRWAAGIEIDFDENGKAIAPFKAGVESLWVTENAEAKFGDFAASDVKQFLEVKADFRLDMASVTGTPLYYFMLTGANFPSGEALQKSETRFINKITDRMESFGSTWEDIMSFAMRMERKGDDNRLFTEWYDPAPSSEKEKLGNIATKKNDIGISEEQAMTEAGYGKEDIKRMQAEKKAKRDSEINSFNAGEDLTDE